MARGRDRAGLRFALGLLRALDLGTVGPVTLVGPPDAPWRTRAAVPKALRDRVTVVPDAGPEERAAALSPGTIALLATLEDAAGPAMREAMASGCAVVAPRGPATDEVARHGVEALLLPPFSRELWSAAVADLAVDAGRRGALGTAAAAAGLRGWDDVAADLEDAYGAALAPARRARSRAEERVLADLRVRAGADVAPERIVAACRERGLGAIAVASPDGIAPAPGGRRRRAGRPGGRHRAGDPHDRRRAGRALPRPRRRAGARPRGGGRGGPRPGGPGAGPAPRRAPPPPSPTALRRLAGDVDCRQLVTGSAEGHGEEEAVRIAQRMGVLGCAGSAAERPEDVGSAVTELRPFHGPSDFLDALADAHLARPPRRRRARAPQGRRRGRRVPDS